MIPLTKAEALAIKAIHQLNCWHDDEWVKGVSEAYEVDLTRVLELMG